MTLYENYVLEMLPLEIAHLIIDLRYSQICIKGPSIQHPPVLRDHFRWSLNTHPTPWSSFVKLNPRGGPFGPL